MKKYQWLLFDADDTLLDFHRSEHDALRETLAEAGLPDGEEIISVYSKINDALWKKLELGQIKKERLRFRRFEELVETYGWPADPVLLADTYARHLSEKNYVLPGAVECCRTLAGTGEYGMYVITNGIRAIQTARFGASAVKPYFVRSFISDEIGHDKPSREFFDAVAAAIPGFDKSRALVIGDSLTSDIRGGRDYGIDTCWLNRRGKEIPSDGSVTYVINEIGQLPALLASVAAPDTPTKEDKNMNDYSSVIQACDRLGIRAERDFPLASITSFRIGGPADLAIFPASEAELTAALAALNAARVRSFVVGNSSDLLFDDAGFRGAVVVTTGVRGILFCGDKMIAACGEKITDAAEAAAGQSLSGLEFAYGIPGCVGGGVFMNAGAYNGKMADVVESVRAYDRETGEILTVPAERLEFSYRHSFFTDRPRYTVLSAVFALHAGDAADIRALMDRNMTSRREKQPLEWPSAGSVFKRPGDKIFVGPMIQEAGLKGTRIGGAEVSRKHAGFIINAGGATADDVRRLVELIRSVILDKYGVSLECEIRSVPEK